VTTIHYASSTTHAKCNHAVTHSGTPFFTESGAFTALTAHSSSKRQRSMWSAYARRTSEYATAAPARLLSSPTGQLTGRSLTSSRSTYWSFALRPVDDDMVLGSLHRYAHAQCSCTPCTRYNRLSNRLYNCIDNRLYRVNKHPTGCQTGLGTTVLNEQPLFVQPVVKPGCTTGSTTGCIHDTAGCQTGCQTGLTTG